ncbi:MAG TPA: site-specific integrase, partial [Opitutaceae bacterium]
MQASDFASDIDAYLAYIDLERGLARNTRESYERDLRQAALFLGNAGVRSWRAVRAADAAKWVHSLSRGARTSQARRITALRMFARFLVREHVREDDFTELMAGPKPGRRLPETLSVQE